MLTNPVPLVAVAALVGACLWWWTVSGGSRADPAPPSAGDPALSGETRAPSLAANDQVPAGQGNRRRLRLLSRSDVAASLTRAGIDGETAARAADLVSRTIPGGEEIDLTISLANAAPEDKPALEWLEASVTDGSGVRIEPGPDGLTAAMIKPSLTRKVTAVRGELDTDSFYTSAVSAGVVDSLISDFANAFSFDFNLQFEVEPGDVFEVAYAETVNPRGERVGKPGLLYVSLTTADKSKELYRFKPPGEKEAGWYDANGTSTVKALMRTPVDGARISSKFGYRKHPILGYNKLHGGTDFAAPSGTPIFAAGDGVVEFAAMKGANGNLTVLRHDTGWRTLYLHQSRFAPGMGPGIRVKQGQVIGYVGTTGRSTGPHLHFEVHIDGKKVDPMSINTGKSKRLDGAALAAFLKTRDEIDKARAAAAS
ncbi:hypothetical protein B2G71_03100 [Novosphingobium sp. PC22D]|nr:hypothetical protein B2G71_03100 [Novosphingobium sp. PC22D]